jgi:hypothetical protein
MLSRKKILYIMPSFNIPPSRGYEVMAYNNIKFLCNFYEIHLIYFNRDNSNILKYNEEFKKIVNQYVEIKQSNVSILFNIILGLFKLQPFQISYYDSKNTRNIIHSFISNNDYDLIIFNLIRTAQFLPNNYEGKTLLNLIDPLVLTYRESRKFNNMFNNIFYFIEEKLLFIYEKKMLPKFNFISLISQNDILKYNILYPNIQFIHLPYGVDFNFYSEIKNLNFSKSDFNIVITGNMGYRYNVISILNFYKNVYKKITNKDIKLFLVGLNPSKKLLYLQNNDSSVTVTGKVFDIRKYIAKADLIVCPILLGVGVQTKLLESMSMNKIIISTHEGLNGIGLDVIKYSDSVFVTSLNQRMAIIIDELINDKITLKNNNNRNYIIQNFNWNLSSKKIIDIIEN